MTAPAATTTYPGFHIFAPFTKVSQQPDGTLMVESDINDETPDDQRELVTFEAVEKASQDYMAWANVREMHDASKASGTMVSLTAYPELRKHTGVIHVVDPDAVKKVLTGVYKGTSLGGRKTAFGGLKKVAGETVREVTGIYWNETSLVDRPSRPTAKLTLLKLSDAEAAAEPPAPDQPAAAEAEAPQTGTDAGPAQQEVFSTPMDPEPAAPAAAEEAAAPAAAAPEAEAPAAASEETAEKATKPGDLAKPAGDVYHGPDGKPMTASITTGQAETKSKASPLVKSAVDDLWSLTDIINQLAALIEREALEGDSADVSKLKAIMADLQTAAAAEAAEVGTPEDTAQREEELAEDAIDTVIVEVVPMYYASIIGDLAKAAMQLRKGALPADQATRIQQLHDMTIAAGAAGIREPVVSQPIVGELAKVAGVDPDEFLAKVTAHFKEAVGPTASPSDLEAMQAEILGALEPVKEELAKIAAQPVQGGPLRYAADDRRGLFTQGDPVGSTDLAAALEKASHAVTDPHLREELGRLAAAEEIAAARRQPSA